MARTRSDERPLRHDQAALEQAPNRPYRNCETGAASTTTLGVAGLQLGFNLSADAHAAAGLVPELSVETVERVESREIRQGDAFQLIEQIDDASVDLIITSPPYWGHRTYGLEHNWNILREWEKEHTRWEPPSLGMVPGSRRRPGSGADPGVVCREPGFLFLQSHAEIEGSRKHVGKCRRYLFCQMGKHPG